MEPRKMARLLLIIVPLLLAGCGGGHDTPGTKLLADTVVVAGTASFSGPRNNYTITANGTSLTVTDNFGTDGSKTISGATRLQFADVTLNLEIAAAAAQVPAASLSSLIELYVAFFNRVPDADGLHYWLGELRAGKALAAIADAFYGAGVANSATTGYTQSMTNADFVNLVYKNVLGRQDGADPDGLKYWTDKLAAGTATRGTLVLTILASAHTFKGNAAYGYVADLLDNKITVARSMAVDAGINFNSNAITRGMAIAAAITPTDILAAKSALGINDFSFSPASVPAIASAAPKPAASLPAAIAIPPAAVAPKPSVPATVAAAPEGTNLKLWLYDPRTPAAPLTTGIFYAEASASPAFKFVRASADGTLYMTLAPGAYLIDTVEPNGMQSTFARHRYSVSVSAAGVASIADQAADARGYFALTLDLLPTVSAAAQALRDKLTALANEPASTFRPASECQLLDQVTPNRSFGTDLSAGFPKVRTRLPSFGRIRALIVPVDFADVPGIDDPVTFFTPIAHHVRNFYHAQSYGRLAFDFEILPAWVRVPFLSTKYGLGGAVGAGDPGGYRKEIFALTDPLIDYSNYDAVYLLVPKEMPMSVMGWGPAITAPIWTSTGYVTNGATGGADMYFNEYQNRVDGATWKWMAHETGHAFGLYDEDYQHAAQTLGKWSLMAHSWSNSGIEMNGWDRYLQGWLTDAQVGCLPKRLLTTAGTTVQISPLVRQNAATKAAMVPLSASKILVVESRRNEGFDRLKAANEGVLVYTVDMKLGQLAGGYRTQRRAGSTDPDFEDAALRPGETVVVDGVSVTVVASSAAGDTVQLRLSQ